MHSLYKRKDPVPTLYVKSLVRYAHFSIEFASKLTVRSYGGPEYSLSLILVGKVTGQSLAGCEQDMWDRLIEGSDCCSRTPANCLL